MTEQQQLSAGQAIYWAGVAFSFGLRLGQIPLEKFVNEPKTTFLYVCFIALVSLFSWFSAGIWFGVNV